MYIYVCVCRIRLHTLPLSMGFNPFAADNTLVCGWRFEHAKHVTMHVVPRKHCSVTENRMRIMDWIVIKAIVSLVSVMYVRSAVRSHVVPMQ